MEKYNVNVQCFNCKRADKYEIEKGITIREFTKNKSCVYCGCKRENLNW